MATKNWNFPVDELIREALGQVGGDWSSGEEQMSARRSLNILLQDLHNRGIPLAQIQRKQVTTQTSVASYTLGTSVADVLDVITISSAGQAIPMERWSFLEYHKINNKMITGRPNNYATERGRTNVTLFIYPVPTSTNYTLEYYGLLYPDTVENSRQSVDINRRFWPALVAGLAYHMAKKRKGITVERLTALKTEFEEMLLRASEEDRDRTSFYIKPRIRR